MARLVRVPLGLVVCTPRVAQELDFCVVVHCLVRHMRGDWGDLDDEDKLANDQALEDGSRLWSLYTLEPGIEVNIITDAEDDDCIRRSTTVMFRGEY